VSCQIINDAVISGQAEKQRQQSAKQESELAHVRCHLVANFRFGRHCPSERDTRCYNTGEEEEEAVEIEKGRQIKQETQNRFVFNLT
jgi:hypothetical protein